MIANSEFRFDIAFLRAFAVIAVVLYHLRVPYFNEGYVGVDIFFVLSGYLMTSIILHKVESGSFSLKEFYFRRLRRIFPALMALILIFLLVVYFLVGIKLYDYSRFAFSSSIFVSNIYYYLNSGYFQADSRLNFLLHTWSLSVELQFYALYPLILISLSRIGLRTRKSIGISLYILAAISFATMIYFSRIDTSFAFYMFPTRAWELLLGGIVFIQQEQVRKLIKKDGRNLISIVFLVLLGCFITGVFSRFSDSWPSAITLLPVVLTAGILVLQSDFKMYHSWVVRFVADISYSWYLWHWPLIVLGSYFALNQTPEWKVVAFLLSFLLGAVSFKLIEQAQIFRKAQYVLYLTGVTIVVTFLGRQIPAEKLLWNSEEAALASYWYTYPRESAAGQFSFDEGHLLSKNGFASFDTTRLHVFVEGKENYLLLGDCHAGMFSYTLRSLAEQNNVNLLQVTGDDTFPVPGVKSIYLGPTELMNYVYLSFLPKYHTKIDKVIISADFSAYSKEQLIRYFDQIEDYFEGYDIPTVYIGQTESYLIEYPVVSMMKRKFNISQDKYLARYRNNANKFLAESSISSKYIDVYLDSNVKKSSLAETYMYDADHFSTFGTDQYRELLNQNIFNK